MMTLDHVGNQEAMVHTQLGQQPLARTTVTSLERSSGTLYCLRARPPALAFWTGTRPQVVTVSPSIVPYSHFYTPSAHGGDAIPRLAGWGRYEFQPQTPTRGELPLISVYLIDLVI